jgi:hypothetical protein
MAEDFYKNSGPLLAEHRILWMRAFFSPIFLGDTGKSGLFSQSAW